MNLLPKIQKFLTRKNHNFAVVPQTQAERANDPKISSSAYFKAAVVDLCLVLAIITFGAQPAKEMASPIASSIKNIYQLAQYQKTSESFSFAPGSSVNKLKKVDVKDLDYLAFFDIPVSVNGDLNTESKGYSSLYSKTTKNLFESAHYQGTKVLITFTQGDNKSVIKFLNNPEAQQNFIDQAIIEVKDSGSQGVAIDFEHRGEASDSYRNKFNDFIVDLKEKMYQEIPSSLVAVVIPDSQVENSLFDVESLSRSSDKLLIMADSFTVPEVKNGGHINPVYGFKEESYWDKISNSLNSFLNKSQKEKLVLERAWYGNGDNYPLYVPNSKPPTEADKEPSHVILDRETVDRLVAGVPSKSREAARKNIPLIGKALEAEGILDSNVLAYALATIEHETAGTFQPLEEFKGRFSARRLGYEGGTNYFGRGFVQLTHLRNYRMVGERIGMGDRLAENPGLAGDPEIAAKILAAFFKDNNVANLASRGQFIAARMPVNPDVNGRRVANMALKYGI